jgi:hypothetical protein
MDTTNCNYFRIVNYNNIQEGYYIWTGCTGIVNVSQINPLQTDYVCANELVQEDYGAPLTISSIGLCPTATATSTVTPTVTPTVSLTSTPTTQTPTPTNTVTPSITPAAMYIQNLRTGGWYQNVCESVNSFANPANVAVYSTKPFSLLNVGDHVFGDKTMTFPPINANFTISDGARFIQISGTLIINQGLCF